MDNKDKSWVLIGVNGHLSWGVATVIGGFGG